KGNDDIFTCDASACIASLNGRTDRRVLYTLKADALATACTPAEIIIDQANAVLPTCTQPQLLISPEFLRREGAIALTASGQTIKWTSVARERGHRPWTARAENAN